MVIKRDAKRQGVESQEFADDGQVVAVAAVWPGHLIDAVGDNGVEAGTHDGAEPAPVPCCARNAAEVSGRPEAIGDNVSGIASIATRQIVFATVVVSGAGRDNTEGDAGLCLLLQCEVNHAVATTDCQGINSAVGDDLTNELAGVVGVSTLESDDIDAAIREHPARPGGRNLRGAMTRVGVSDQSKGTNLSCSQRVVEILVVSVHRRNTYFYVGF